jgi:hypothetical protein
VSFEGDWEQFKRVAAWWILGLTFAGMVIFLVLDAA